MRYMIIVKATPESEAETIPVKADADIAGRDGRLP